MKTCLLSGCQTTMSDDAPDFCPEHNEGNIQQSMWKDVHKIILDSGDVYDYDRAGAIKTLMSKYSINEHGMDKGSQ